MYITDELWLFNLGENRYTYLSNDLNICFYKPVDLNNIPIEININF